MKKQNFVDSLTVKEPCAEKWEEMTGGDLVRFCSHCAKNVNDISAITRKQAKRLVRESGGNLCVRYRRDPKTGGPVFADKLYKITRRAPVMAAGVMSASLSLSAMAYAQGGVSVATPEARSPIAAAECTDEKPVKGPQPGGGSGSGKISGTIKDPIGAVIPGARVVLTESGGRKQFSTSDENGEYAFENVPDGKYSIEVTSPGFQTHIKEDLAVDGGAESRTDITMEVGMEVFLSGAVAVSVVEYKEPLFIAVQNEEVDEVRELLARGAKVNTREDNKITPIFLAAESGNVEITQILLDAGAKVNARTGDKETPLMRLDGDAGAELVELLVRYGADVNAADKEGDTALIRAAAEAEWTVIKALIDAGADVNVKNKTGRTALMNAAESEDLEGVRVLLAAGADVTARDEEGDSAWDLTATPEIEQLLESYGAKADHSDDGPDAAAAAEDPSDG